jgi:NAD(P)-dependent dehydrogenase (short-subunit alcohol dehydrogenase family)
VGHRARAPRHPGERHPPDRREHADERRPRAARRSYPQQIAERSAGNLLPVPWIEPEDVAQAVLYLASDRARFVTGASLVLDAGLLTR